MTGDRPFPPDGGDQVPGWLQPMVTMLAYGVAGAVLIDRRPDLPFGWLLAGTAVLIAVHVVVLLPAYGAVAHGDQSALARWGLSAASLGFLPIAVQGLVNVRFPSGRPASRKGAVLEIALIAGTALVVLGGMLGPTGTGDLVDGLTVRHPLAGYPAVADAANAAVACAPVVVLLGLVAGLGVVVRFFRAQGIARQQLKWRAVGVIVGLALFPLAVTESMGGYDAVVDAPVFVLTLAIPVLRYKLWAIDTILRRSLVYAVITAVLVLGFIAVSVTLTPIASSRVAAPVAAAVVALAFAPLRSRAQRFVDKVFYGDRSNPYRTLQDLGRRLNAEEQGDVLGSLGESVARSLRLPYVAIERPDGTCVAAHGTPGPRQERWPLAYDGFLVASPRRGEEGFDERDRALLQDIAGPVGVALRARGLTAELLRSRQRLVTAREEERRRLRRELHDGLGPVLTAVGLSLDAARARLASAPEVAERHVSEAKAATAQALADLRRLVHGLRPPALDDLGLVGALRSQAERLSAGSPLSVTIDAGELPRLPAAVEVAVFRTAVEAMTNAVRHSDGKHCRVRLTAGARELILDVRDDGTPNGPWLPGVGLTAMRERADELGGSLRAGGGTVTAHFPLPPEGGP